MNAIQENPMTMKKFLSMLFACSLVFALACGGGKEAAKDDEEEVDDNAPQTASVSTEGNPGSSPTAPAAATPAVIADAATVTGNIKFAAAAMPAMGTIPMGADPYCQSQHTAPAKDEEVVVGPGGELANVFVYIKDVKGSFAAPTKAEVLDQKGCQYFPHVHGVMVGQPFEIKNSDATLHNVHAMAEINSAFNEGQPVQGMVATKKFDKAEIKPFRIKCDVHGWMKSYLAVMPHPYYAVSSMAGSFSIPNLPPGQYTVVAWHEKYGQQEQQITVGAKESKAVEFTFKG
jgi:hypothetical protein